MVTVAWKWRECRDRVRWGLMLAWDGIVLGMIGIGDCDGDGDEEAGV